jgi:hypothetical protein
MNNHYEFKMSISYNEKVTVKVVAIMVPIYNETNH